MIHGHKTYKDLVKKEKKYNIIKEKNKLLIREVKTHIHNTTIQTHQHNFDELENDIRTVENLIQEAKDTLAKYWDAYTDIQVWINEAEQLRMSTDILLSKLLSKCIE